MSAWFHLKTRQYERCSVKNIDPCQPALSAQTLIDRNFPLFLYFLRVKRAFCFMRQSVARQNGFYTCILRGDDVLGNKCHRDALSILFREYCNIRNKQ